MSNTHSKQLVAELERMVEGMRALGKFSSPVNQEAVEAIWSAKKGDQIIEVVFRDILGNFFHGLITDVSAYETWEVTADDGKVFQNVRADKFSSIRLEWLIG